MHCINKVGPNDFVKDRCHVTVTAFAQPKHTFTSQHEGIVLEVYMNYSTPDKEMLKRRQEDFNLRTPDWSLKRLLSGNDERIRSAFLLLEV